MNRNGNGKGDSCDPAHSVIKKLGGVRALARELCLNPATVSKWQTTRAHKGTDGLIPARYHWSLLQLAKRRSIKLKAEELTQR